jgi:hypothetical protein
MNIRYFKIPPYQLVQDTTVPFHLMFEEAPLLLSRKARDYLQAYFPMVIWEQSIFLNRGPMSKNKY